MENANARFGILSPVHTVAEKCDSLTFLRHCGQGFMRLKPCPHCRGKVRLSQKSDTVAEKCDCRRKRRDKGDSLTFLRDYSRALFCDSDGVDRL